MRLWWGPTYFFFLLLSGYQQHSTIIEQCIMYIVNDDVSLYFWAESHLISESSYHFHGTILHILDFYWSYESSSCIPMSVGFHPCRSHIFPAAQPPKRFAGSTASTMGPLASISPKIFGHGGGFAVDCHGASTISVGLTLSIWVIFFGLYFFDDIFWMIFFGWYLVCVLKMLG